VPMDDNNRVIPIRSAENASPNKPKRIAMSVFGQRFVVDLSRRQGLPKRKAEVTPIRGALSPGRAGQMEAENGRA